MVDGALPIVKRDLTEILATIRESTIADIIEKEHAALPEIRFLFFQFKFSVSLTNGSDTIGKKMMKHAINTVDPLNFYTNIKGTIIAQRFQFEKILQLKNVQPLINLCKYRIGFVVTSGRVTDSAVTFVESLKTTSVFHIDAERSLPGEYSSEIIRACNRYSDICKLEAIAIYKAGDFTGLLKRQLLNCLDKSQLVVVADEVLHHTVKGLNRKTKGKIITLLVGPE